MLAEGTQAPSFKVQDHRDRTVSLSDFAGRNLVLWFYPKADTPGWTVEGRGFRDHSEQFNARNAAILGVSFDTVSENAAFAEKFDFPHPLLCDTARTVGIAYGACDDASARSARRISYLIGPDGKVRKAYAKVDAPTHAETVLRDLG